MPAATFAQEDELPPLINTASIGELVIFYPDGWQLTNGDELRLVQDDETPITITARILETGQIDPEALPDWMLTELLISPATSISPVDYAGLEGWIAQGAFLFEPGVFSAVVVLPVSSERVSVIRIDSPTTDIGEDAPLITAILEKVVILPGSTVSGIETVPDDDFIIETFVTSAEEFTFESASQQKARDFLVNGQPARMQLTADRVSGRGILTFTRNLEVDQLLVMRVTGETPQALVDDLPRLQALFATIEAGDQ